MARLQSLSPALLRQIIDWDPGLLPLFLYRLGSRSLFEATREGIYRDLVVTDTSITSFENAKALTVYAAPGYGEHVRRLIIRPPGVLACDSPTSKGLERLQDNVLFDLLSCLSGLAVIEWRADRLPPIELCTVLGGVAPSLKDFVFELAERSFTTARERRASTTGGTACDEGEDDEDDEDDTAKGPLRWDAPHFDSLPITSLARLSLCGLSATGSHVLTSILSESSIPLLNDIELAKTRFVDDQLMRSIANGAKRIERISILEMHGTRLTTEGIAAVMTGLMLLRELEIVDVEGICFCLLESMRADQLVQAASTRWAGFSWITFPARLRRFASLTERIVHITRGLSSTSRTSSPSFRCLRTSSSDFVSVGSFLLRPWYPVDTLFTLISP